MDHAVTHVAICLLLATMLNVVEPVMVKFGTKEGPIEPLQLPSTSTRPIIDRNPAPVSEETFDDAPSSTYRPLQPRQYQDKLYSYRPRPNLLLGTPLDQKYTPSLHKYNVYKKQQDRNPGVSYTGPQFFEKQPYEYDLINSNNNNNHRTILQPSVQYVKPQYYMQKRDDRWIGRVRYVPQIGVVYSSGVKYYIPQLVYHSEPVGREENSVYDETDDKYLQYRNY